jgi:hypothetical protein
MKQSIIKTSDLFNWISEKEQSIISEMDSFEKNDAIMIQKITSLQKELELLRELNVFIVHNLQEERFIFENEIFETHV